MPHAAEHCRRPDGTTTKDLIEDKSLVRLVRQSHGHGPAADFGPLALLAVRQAMVDAGRWRTRVNK